LKFPKNLSAIGRYDFFDPNKNIDNDANKRVIAGFAWDMGNHNTWLLDYDRVIYEDSREADYRVQGTLQINF
jgi:hypothetical protein